MDEMTRYDWEDEPTLPYSLPPPGPTAPPPMPGTGGWRESRPYEDDPPTLKRLHPDLRQPPQALPIAASLLAIGVLMALAWVIKYWVLR